MRRFYLLWIYAVLLAATTAGAVQSYIEARRSLANERSKSASLASSMEESIEDHLESGTLSHLNRTIKALALQQKLIGIAVCAYSPAFLQQASSGLPADFQWKPLCERDEALAVAHTELKLKATGASPSSHDLSAFDRRIQYYFHRLDTSDLIQPAKGATLDTTYVLILARDLSALRAIWVDSFLRGFLITLVFGMALLLLVTSQMRHWFQVHLTIFHKNLRSLIAGKKPHAVSHLRKENSIKELRPISEDIDKLAQILALRPETIKGERALPQSLRQTIAQKNLVVIANREPYIHKFASDQSIEVIRPASGLVTALEPILRQCGGLWVAHGSGTADFAVTDPRGIVDVPPGKPTYQLKRVALTEDQEKGYYYGFSNEGLWPLCHLAHTRPTFRLSDWNSYREVNALFAESIEEETLGPNTLFLVQDYHFALLPETLRQRSIHKSRLKNGKNTQENPKIGLFWHIPWPNPEAFGICPWNQNLLRGMLGADVIGFHTQYHCNNFLESCNRYLEARIDYEHFSVTMENHETRVRAFPIGIDTTPVKILGKSEISELKRQYGITAEFVAVGVDRIDYTKGIVERVEAVERFLTKYPEFIGRFSLVQMGSPSRTHIPAYQRLHEELEGAVARVNARFALPNSNSSEGGENRSPPGYLAVHFIPTHHEWKDIQYFYQLGDICLVTSLHDGMNLVAKEYVWCQKPERGSLILSKFTGASRELTEAFIVNPYSIEEMADAIHAALCLSPSEKAARMTAMREKVHSRNAYRWASELIEALLANDSSTTLHSNSSNSSNSPSGPDSSSGAPLSGPGGSHPFQPGQNGSLHLRGQLAGQSRRDRRASNTNSRVSF